MVPELAEGWFRAGEGFFSAGLVWVWLWFKVGLGGVRVAEEWFSVGAVGFEWF